MSLARCRIVGYRQMAVLLAGKLCSLKIRLRIEEAQIIRMMKPAINRRGEETGIDFLA